MMTQNDFLSGIKSRGAILATPISQGQITLTTTTLQRMRMAMLPFFMTELYRATGGINLGNGYIFGPTDITFNNSYPVPSIIKINKELVSIPALRGKTVFGRNDLFWFAFDAFGVCYMLDNLNVRELRKYDDSYRAMSDCLLGGKL